MPQVGMKAEVSRAKVCKLVCSLESAEAPWGPSERAGDTPELGSQGLWHGAQRVAIWESFQVVPGHTRKGGVCGEVEGVMGGSAAACHLHSGPVQ